MVALPRMVRWPRRDNSGRPAVDGRVDQCALWSDQQRKAAGRGQGRAQEARPEVAGCSGRAGADLCRRAGSAGGREAVRALWARPSGRSIVDELVRQKLAREMTHQEPIQSERPLADWLSGMNTMQKLGLLQVPVVSDVAGLLGDIQQYRDEPESRGLLNYSLTGLGLLPFMPNMTVFHGSPHKWLPEEGFSMGRPRLDKIGTGEGAQAYGYGMYFAESPGVARSYANQNKGSAF